ncbi:hypothetical protein [Nocardioides cavernaquae]|nr:hypothetical protein [Nocardioides cavernaquae]
MTVIPERLRPPTTRADEQPDERLGLALVLAIILLIVACSFLLA